MRGLAVALALSLAAPAAAEEPWVEGPGGGITAARFAAEADVYPHRIMGSIREKRALEARDAAGRSYRVDLRNVHPYRNVFEDIAPRLADVDADGEAEVVVVETDPERGASLAIYGIARGELTKEYATPYIGQPFRWLAPAGIADFNGDGITDIAYVETPHLGKTLRVWTFAPGGLTELARLRGLTNHRIGDETIAGGVRDCGAGPEIVVADAAWQRVMAVTIDSRQIKARPLGLPATGEGFAKAMACAE